MAIFDVGSAIYQALYDANNDLPHPRLVRSYVLEAEAGLGPPTLQVQCMVNASTPLYTFPKFVLYPDPNRERGDT